MRDTLSELQAILALLNATPADLVQLQFDQLCREMEATMTDEQKVKSKYQKSWAKFTDSDWIIRENTDFWSIVLGQGNSPDEAWADAARRLDKLKEDEPE